MNISVNDKSKTEKTEAENIRLQKGDEEILTSINAPFSDFLKGQINESGLFVNNSTNIQDIDFSYDTVSMDLTDALFFVNLTHEGQFSVQSLPDGNFQNLIKTETIQTSITQKTIDVTNQLTTLIEKAQKTQKPVRISFDNDISVILKIDKQGKVSAEFIPGSLEAENYLMTNVSALKQRFDEQNLPYTSLSYRQNKQGKGKEKNKGEA